LCKGCGREPDSDARDTQSCPEPAIELDHVRPRLFD
jgi:hypothetical protein